MSNVCMVSEHKMKEFNASYNSSKVIKVKDTFDICCHCSRIYIIYTLHTFCYAAAQSKYTLCKSIKVVRVEMKTFAYPVDCINIESDFGRAVREACGVL